MPTMLVLINKFMIKNINNYIFISDKTIDESRNTSFQNGVNTNLDEIEL